MLAAWAFFPPAAAYLLQELLQRPLFHERYLIAASPAPLLLLALGLASARGWARGLSLLGLLFLLGSSSLAVANHYFDPKYAKADVRGLVEFVEARLAGSDALLTFPGRKEVYDYYAKRPLQREVFPSTAFELRPMLEDLAKRHHQIWLSPYVATETDLFAQRWLAEHAYLVERRWFNTAPLYRYSIPGERPSLQPVGAAFGPGIALESYGLTPGSLEPGQVAHLTLYWRAHQVPTGDLKVSVRLLDARRHLFAQVDREPVAGFRPTSGWGPGEPIVDNYGVLVPAGSPPGPYQLEVVVYDPRTGRPLEVRRGEQSATELSLAGVTVTRASRALAPGLADLRGAPLADLEAGLKLLAAELPRGTLQAGARLAVVLWWQGPQTPGPDREVVLELVDRNGRAVLQHVSVPAEGTFPFSQWGPGQLVQDVHDLSLPRSLPSGSYSWRLFLTDGASPGRPVLLGQVEVVAAQVNFALPTLQHIRSANLGNVAELLGYDLEPSPASGGQVLHLTLYWRAVGDGEASYKVFTHLVSADGRLVAQHDSVPCQGGCPTDQWVQGEVLRDEHPIRLPSDAPPGNYLLQAGMYQPQTGQRLPVLDQTGQVTDNRVVLTELTVQ